MTSCKVLKALAPGTPPLLDGFFRPSDAAPGLEQYDEFAKEIHAALIEDVREKVAVEAVIDLLRVTRHNAHNVFVPMPSSLWREGSVGPRLCKKQFCFFWSAFQSHRRSETETEIEEQHMRHRVLAQFFLFLYFFFSIVFPVSF